MSELSSERVPDVSVEIRFDTSLPPIQATEASAISKNPANASIARFRVRSRNRNQKSTAICKANAAIPPREPERKIVDPMNAAAAAANHRFRPLAYLLNAKTKGMGV